MKDNSINIEELEKNHIKSEIGRGLTATCFLLNDGNIFKKFHGNINYNMLYIEELQKFSNPFITFPKQLVYSNNELVGYIKNYAPGTEIDKLDESINLKDFVKSLEILEDNIYGLFFDLLFTDLSGENIVYDSNTKKISIIDVDFFEPRYNKKGLENYNFTRMNVFLENKKWINQSFYSILRMCNGISPIIDEITSEASSGLSSTSFELQKIINMLEYLTNKTITTYGDFEKAINEVKENNYGKTLIRYRRYNNGFNIND